MPGKKYILSGGGQLIYLAAATYLSGGRQINWAIFVSACTFARCYYSGLLHIHLESGKEDPLDHRPLRHTH